MELKENNIQPELEADKEDIEKNGFSFRLDTLNNMDNNFPEQKKGWISLCWFPL